MFKAQPLIINDLQSYAFSEKLKMAPFSLKMHPLNPYKILSNICIFESRWFCVTMIVCDNRKR